MVSRCFIVRLLETEDKNVHRFLQTDAKGGVLIELDF